MSVTGWTDERVEALRRLWGEGLSASQIAKQLGDVSRNAVIGKVHRLGLEGRVKGAEGAESTAADTDPSEGHDAPAEAVGRPATDVEAADAVPATEGEVEETVPVAANDAGAPAAAEVADDGVVAPVPLKLKLTQLTERTCKWPVGDPMHDDFHFCGHEAEEGRPYCEYHSGLAFQPASERRRVR